jgi:hypothetical protein
MTNSQIGISIFVLDAMIAAGFFAYVLCHMLDTEED